MSFYVKPSKNKGSNRHSLDIIRDMLSAASVKARKTRIMYQSNLSFTQVEKYLQSLLENGLLDHDGEACYFVTKKGLDFLRLYGEYIERCKLIKTEVDQSARQRQSLEHMCFNHDRNGERMATRKVALPEA